MKEIQINTHKSNFLHARYSTIENATADMLYCHGFMEHSGRYEEEAKLFNNHKINFYAFDLRNHGLSSGSPKAYIHNFEELVKDLDKVISHFQLGIERPFFLFGHSMGGLIVVSYLLNNNIPKPKIYGMLLSAPLLAPKSDMAPVLQKLSGIVSFLAPRLKTIPLDVQEVSTDKKQVELYIKDPLICHDKIRARSGAEMLKQMKKVNALLSNLSIPFIIQHSIHDQLTEFEGSQLLYAKASSVDKMMIPLENSKHEIIKDVEREKVLNAYINWMKDRI